MKPRIGITMFEDPRDQAVFNTVNNTYVYSVIAAGGIPFLLPVAQRGTDIEEYADSYVGNLDGLLLSGGGDLSPHVLGEAPLPCINRISESRDLSELGLFRAANERRLPILGICRGCQVVNVALGGTLYQDIPSQVPGAHGHSPENLAMDELYHDIEIEAPRSRLAQALGAGILRTNSFHHQSAKDPGKGLIVTARSADGILEGLEAEDPNRFLVGVQFHPEALTLRYPVFLGLFRAFVESAIER